MDFILVLLLGLLFDVTEYTNSDKYLNLSKINLRNDI
jgi:hypothetical protein